MSDREPQLVPLGTATERLAERLGGDRAEARIIVAEVGRSGELHAIARKAEGLFEEGRDVVTLNESDWKIPRSVWSRPSAQTDAQWERGYLIFSPDPEDRHWELYDDGGRLRLSGVAVSSEDIDSAMASLPEPRSGNAARVPGEAGRALISPMARSKLRGPAPDTDWPDVIAKVTQDCIAAGYTRPSRRGDLAAIQTLLLTAMAEKDKHFSDDTASKHAKKVIAALPDNSTS